MKYLKILLIVLVSVISCQNNQKNKLQRPEIKKLGTIDCDLVETTPIIFKNKLFRFEYVRKGYEANQTGDSYFRFVDHETGAKMMESGAILMYLANKTGKLMAAMGEQYWKQMEWLMFQMGHIGPMLGQTHHFVKFNPGKAPYAEERYSKENARLYQVLENRLKDRNFIVDDYSIVDIATWPWISRYEFQQMDLNDYPRLKDWYLRIADRPAVQKGYAVPQDLLVPIPD